MFRTTLIQGVWGSMLLLNGFIRWLISFDTKNVFEKSFGIDHWSVAKHYSKTPESEVFELRLESRPFEQIIIT